MLAQLVVLHHNLLNLACPPADFVITVRDRLFCELFVGKPSVVHCVALLSCIPDPAPRPLHAEVRRTCQSNATHEIT